MIDDDNAQLAAVIRVDRSGAVQQGNLVFQGQPAAGADLGLGKRRQGHGNTGFDQTAFAGTDQSLLIGEHIISGVSGMSFFRQAGFRSELFDSDGIHILFPPISGFLSLPMI